MQQFGVETFQKPSNAPVQLSAIQFTNGIVKVITDQSLNPNSALDMNYLAKSVQR